MGEADLIVHARPAHLPAVAVGDPEIGPVGVASWCLWKDVPMFTGAESLSGMGETGMIGFLLALLIGVVAGLRAMTAPAVVSWATNLGWLHVGATSLAFLDCSWVRWILTVLALGELVTDQLPSTPSRTVPVQFAGRIVTGALSGAKIGVSSGSLIVGADHGAPFRAIHPFLVTPSGP
jgi:uncharacterized membrane protein